MHITIFIGGLIGGGAERVVCDLASYMVSYGHDVQILTSGRIDISYPISDEVDVRSLENKKRIKNSKIRILTKFCRLFSFIVKNNTDVYVVFLPETIRAIMMLRKIIRRPIIVTERANPKAYTDYEKKYLLKAFSKADGAVFQTLGAQAFYSESIKDFTDSVVIPNAVISKGLEHNYSMNYNYIIGVGRFVKEKNFTLLIRAFSKILEYHPEYKLIIYGEGPLLDTYNILCDNLGISDKVSFPGYVSDLSKHISDASIFVLSSDSEGMPNALMEAMACGLPCVATDCEIGGPRFLIRNRINGLLVNVGDEVALVGAILELIDNPGFSYSIGNEAKKIVSDLSPDYVYRKWEKYLCSAKYR